MQLDDDPGSGGSRPGAPMGAEPDRAGEPMGSGPLANAPGQRGPGRGSLIIGALFVAGAIAVVVAFVILSG